MNQMDAINQRQSRRAYESTPIAQDKCKILIDIIGQYNQQSGLSIQFIQDGKAAFQGLNITYGMFTGVQSFFAMVGKKSDPDLKEKIGYYGELLVLEATKLNLGTCWVGGTFNRKKCPCILKEDDNLVLIIIVGNATPKKTFKENAIYKLSHRGSKSIDDLSTVAGTAPDWFIEGMKAVQKAPLAINLQPVHFEYNNGRVTAEVNNTSNSQPIDLGIAKAHFEIAAGGKFEFGNKAEFTKA